MQSIHSRITNFNDGLKSLTNSLANTRNPQNTNSIVSQRVSNVTLNQIYKTGLGNKIVNIKINTAFKEGILIDGKQDHDLKTKRIIEEIREASRWMLAFGRGVIAIIEENKETSEPLSISPNLNRITIRAFDGSMVTATNADIDVSSQGYMKPKMYQIRNKTFHPSRIIDFTYVKPIEEELPTYQYGGISEFELIYSQIINDGIVERSSAAIIEKNSTMFYKIEGFKNLLQTGKESSLLKYFTNLENLRSIYGAGIVDKEDNIEVHSQTLTNLSEVDMVTLRRLALVTSIPYLILVGEGAKGLSSTGTNEMKMLNATIENLQENYLAMPLSEVFAKLGISDDVKFNFPEQQTPKEKAELHGIILDNAVKLQALGLNLDGYLKENGINLDEINEDEFNEFSSDEEDLDADTTE